MTHTQRIIHRFDNVIQTIILTGAVLSGLAGLFFEAGFGLFYFLLLFLVGVWQLSSALFRMIAFRNFTTFTYFMSAIVYCLLLVSATPLLDFFGKWDYVVGIWFVGVVPAIGAIWYLRHCLQMEPQQSKAVRADLVPERPGAFHFSQQSVKISDKRMIPFQS